MIFYVIIRKRVAEVLSSGGRLPLLVCGNHDNRIAFTFDDEWSLGAEKTARFVYRENMGKGRLVYRDVQFTGNVVAVPVLENVSELWVGVMSSDGITTSAARFACLPSIGGFSAVESGSGSNSGGESDGDSDTGSGNTITTEEVEVMLKLADGDQIVTTASGNPMSSVTIIKPTTLTPENIRAGVMIAGVTGTYAPSETTESAALTAPTISLDGDDLTVSYDENTKNLLLHFNGEEAGAFYAPDGSGTCVLQLDGWLAGYEAGTYTVTVKAYGENTAVSSSESNAVTYVYSGASEIEGTRAVGIGVIGGGEAEFAYKLGRSDLSSLVEVWDTVEPDGTFTTGFTISSLYDDSCVLIYLPEGASVKSYARCELKTYDDSRFVQLCNFEEEGVIVCNFNAPIVMPAVSLDGTTLVIEQSGRLPTQYLVARGDASVGAFDRCVEITPTESTTRVDISPYLKVGVNYFKVYVYDGEDMVDWSDCVEYTMLSGITAPSLSLDGSILTITPGEGVATSYEILSSEDGVTYSTATTVDANGDEAVTVDITEYAVYEETYFKVRAVNTDTGERAETKTAVTYAPNYNGVYTLSVIGGGTGYENQFYYAVNMSTDDFGSGKYDGMINGTGVIEDLSYGDIVFIRPYSWSATIEVLDADDTFTYTIEYNDFLVVATNIKGDGSITLKNILA